MLIYNTADFFITSMCAHEPLLNNTNIILMPYHQNSMQYSPMSYQPYEQCSQCERTREFMVNAIEVEKMRMQMTIDKLETNLSDCRVKLIKMTLDMEDEKNKNVLIDDCKSTSSKTPSYIRKVIVPKTILNKRTYIPLSIRIKLEDKLKDIFNNISSIEDIIELSKRSDVNDFNFNSKFRSLINLAPTLQKLSDMIGMDDVKKTVFNHICSIVHYDSALNNAMLNVVITGVPGIGKTHLGNILAELYCSLGYASNKTISAPKRPDLIAEYLGQTAVKTQKVIDNTKNGILLIDEAYSIGDKDDMFTKECLNLLNQNMTEMGSKLIVIIIGYKKSLDSNFFALNEGLRRRFQITYDITSPSSDNLSKIFNHKIKELGWFIETNMDDFFKTHYDEFPFFGGDIDTFITECISAHSYNLMKTCIDVSLTRIKKFTDTDIKTALVNFKQNKSKCDVDFSYLHKAMYV